MTAQLGPESSPVKILPEVKYQHLNMAYAQILTVLPHRLASYLPKILAVVTSFSHLGNIVSVLSVTVWGSAQSANKGALGIKP